MLTVLIVFFLCAAHLPPIVFARKISLSFLSSGFQLKGLPLKGMLIIPLYGFHDNSVKAFSVDPHRFCSKQSRQAEIWTRDPTLLNTHIPELRVFFIIISLIFSIAIIQLKNLSFVWERVQGGIWISLVWLMFNLRRKDVRSSLIVYSQTY